MTVELVQLLLGAGLAVLGWFARHKGFLAPKADAAKPATPAPAPGPAPAQPALPHLQELIDLLARLKEHFKQPAVAAEAPAPPSIQATIPLNLQLQATATHAPQA